MNKLMIFYIMLPFIGTCSGALIALFIKSGSQKLLSALYGFSAGIMLSASVWSLLIPSIEKSQVSPRWLLPTLSLLLAIIFMLVFDKIADKLQKNEKEYNKVIFAVCLHNFPEGLAVGIAVSAFINGDLSSALVFALSFGVAVQNVPEGAIVSMPVVALGKSKMKAFLTGAMSAVIELLGAVLALIATTFAGMLMPFLLAFSAGAMLWVTFRELMPSASGDIGAITCSLGFILMMALDVGLG